MNYMQCPWGKYGFEGPLSDYCPECGVELLDGDPEGEGDCEG